MKKEKTFTKPTWKSYLTTKGIANYGIPTALVCLIIYYFMRGEDMLLTAVASDLWIAVFVTTFICALTCIPGVVSDIKKNKAPEMPLDKDIHPAFKHLSDKLVVQSIEIAFVSMLVFGMIPGGICATIAMMAKKPELAINANLYWILKSIYSGVFIAIAMKHTTYVAVSQRQKTMARRVY